MGSRLFLSRPINAAIGLVERLHCREGAQQILSPCKWLAWPTGSQRVVVAHSSGCSSGTRLPLDWTELARPIPTRRPTQQERLETVLTSLSVAKCTKPGRGEFELLAVTRMHWQANEMTPERSGDRLHPIDTGNSGQVCGTDASKTGALLRPIDSGHKAQDRDGEQEQVVSGIREDEEEEEEAEHAGDRRLQPAAVLLSVASQLVLAIGRLLGALLTSLLAWRSRSAQAVEEWQSIG